LSRWYPGKFLGLCPKPQYATHGTTYDNAVLILKEGIIRCGLEESVSFSLDGVGWGDISFLFPFHKVRSITKPVFYANIVSPVVLLENFRLSAWYAIDLKEVYSESNVPLSLARSIVITSRKYIPELISKATERKLPIITSPPDTPLYRWGEEVKELVIADRVDEVLRKIKAYNRMIATEYNIELSEVEEAIKRLKKFIP